MSSQGTFRDVIGMFDEQVSRKPDRYPWAREFIDAIWKSFWTPSEFDFKSDMMDFKHRLSEEEREVAVRVLSAIGQIEIAVKTFWAKLGENLPHPSLSDLGFAMANSEVIHNLAYEKLLEKLQLFDVFEENLRLPVVSGRVNYLRKYLKRAYGDDKRKQYVYAIILFTLFVENVSLFSQFYVILWMNRNKNVLRDTAQQVKYTRNEEMLHAQVGIRIINTLRSEYPDLFDDELRDRILHESQEALKSEGKIIDWMLGGYEGAGISAPILRAYVARRMNDSLAQIGYPPVVEVDEELASQTRWMDEELLGNNIVDFFHAKPTDYAKHDKDYEAEDLF